MKLQAKNSKKFRSHRGSLLATRALTLAVGVDIRKVLQDISVARLSGMSGQGTNPESVQDQSLNEGDIEPLSEGASEGEQMEQLQKLLENQDPSPTDSPDRKPGNDSEEGQAETSQPKNGEKNPNQQP